MPTITITLPAAVTELQAEPFERVRGVSGQPVQTVSLTGGAGSIVVAATGTDWCWRFTEHGPGWAKTRFCTVAGPGSYAALVDVDPGTLTAPLVEPSAAWEATLAAVTPGQLASAADRATIQSAIDSIGQAFGGGGTVRLAPGALNLIDGTIQMRSRVTLDLNGGTLKAVDNSAFTDVNLGTDAITLTAFNPVSIKPLVSIIGTVGGGGRLSAAKVVNGTVDGNGVNQPDSGSYANIAVFEADDTALENVVSLNARPGLTILDGGGQNTGRRSFCLFVAHALNTVVKGGKYRNAGYDSIGLREGATDTQLMNVSASLASKGAIQVATGALRTKIVGGVYDNTECPASTWASGNAIFCHAAYGLTVSGATFISGGSPAAAGSCLSIFGDTTWGSTVDVDVANCTMRYFGTAGMVSVTTQYVRRIKVRDITYSHSAVGGGAVTGPVMLVNGAAAGLDAARWVGSSTTSSAAFQLTSLTDFSITDMDSTTGSAGNPHFSMTSCARGKVSGKYSQPLGPAALLTSCDSIKFDGITPTCSDGPQALGGNTNIDVINCDLTGVINANKNRLFGCDSGRVRNNRGAITEAVGSATVAAASTSVVVTHGLWPGTSTAATPRTDRAWTLADFQVSFAGNPGSASKVWVSAVSSTQVTFTVDAAPGGSGAVLSWSARMDRNT